MYFVYVYKAGMERCRDETHGKVLRCGTPRGERKRKKERGEIECEKKKLVPLLEGLCSLNPCVLELFILRSHLLLIFWGRKNMLKEKKQLVQNLIPPPGIYIYMCTLYTYTDIFILSFSPSGFLHALEMSHPDLSAHIPSTQTL